MGAVSFRFFSETASAEGLLNYSASLLLFRDPIPLLCSGASPLSSLIRLLYPGPAFPTLAAPFSSLKNINILNHITSLILIIPFNLNYFISSFSFRVELSLHASSSVFCSVSLSLIIFPGSSFLAFSSIRYPSRQAPRTSPACSTTILRSPPA